jgi:hypothetical protein
MLSGPLAIPDLMMERTAENIARNKQEHYNPDENAEGQRTPLRTRFRRRLSVTELQGIGDSTPLPMGHFLPALVITCRNSTLLKKPSFLGIGSVNNQEI